MPDGRMSDSVVFTSWKEIASYLGKGVRTVQRWEAQFGLPVQRPNSRAKGIVRASRGELDQWIATRWAPRNGQAGLPNVAVPSVPLFTGSVTAGVEASQELRMQNRVLLRGLQQSVEELKHNCEDLAVNMAANTELQQDPTTRTRFESPWPAHKHAKAG